MNGTWRYVTVVICAFCYGPRKGHDGHPFEAFKYDLRTTLNPRDWR
jgi:hypothetical protein